MSPLRRFIALSASVAFAASPAAAAGPPPELTLDQAIERAVADSRRLAAADADTDAAAAALAGAKASRRPSIELSEEALRTDNPTLVFSNKLGQERFSVADFAVDSLNRPRALTNFRTRLSFELPLWTGGRLRHHTAAARLGLEASELGRESERQQVVHRVVDAFHAVLTAEQRLAAAVKARETVRAHVRLIADLHGAGLAVESDLLQVRVRESELNEGVSRAASAVAVARAELNLAMGSDQDAVWRLAPPRAITAAEAGGSLEELLVTARSRRPDLAAMRARVEAAGRLRAAARADFLPSLGAGAFVEANGEEPAGFDGSNWGALAALRWDLFDGFAARARARQAEHRERAEEERSALHAERVELEVRRAYHELQTAAERIEQARRAVTWAERALEIVEDRYREGLATLVELLEAEAGLSDARARAVAAGGDLARSASALDLAVGRL